MNLKLSSHCITFKKIADRNHIKYLASKFIFFTQKIKDRASPHQKRVVNSCAPDG